MYIYKKSKLKKEKESYDIAIYTNTDKSSSKAWGNTAARRIIINRL